MNKKHVDKSALENYKISIVKGGGCPCQAGMIRAVVELSDNLSGALPHLNRVIKGCAYNPEEDILSFHREGKSVIVYPQKIVINNAEDETEARRMVDYLRDVVNAADES